MTRRGTYFERLFDLRFSVKASSETPFDRMAHEAVAQGIAAIVLDHPGLNEGGIAPTSDIDAEIIVEAIEPRLEDDKRLIDRLRSALAGVGIESNFNIYSRRFELARMVRSPAAVEHGALSFLDHVELITFDVEALEQMAFDCGFDNLVRVVLWVRDQAEADELLAHFARAREAATTVLEMHGAEIEVTADEEQLERGDCDLKVSFDVRPMPAPAERVDPPAHLGDLSDGPPKTKCDRCGFEMPCGCKVRQG